MRLLHSLATMTALAVLGSSCGPGNAGPADVGSVVDAPPVVACRTAADCDDGLFCDGSERCEPSAGAADEEGCLAAPPPCAAPMCDEAADTCSCADPDADGDGSDAMACGGTDCDDDDPLRAPSRPELCDAVDLDEDCDPSTFGSRDVDADTFVDAACCNGTGAARRCGDDCDDASSASNPGLIETCDSIDNDCDVAIDETVLSTFYRDLDGDGYGRVESGTMQACEAGAGYVTLSTDCDDAQMSWHPGAIDTCDMAMANEDCAGVPNDRTPPCACLDGAVSACVEAGVCATYMRTCNDGAWDACPYTGMPEGTLCNRLDDDCDGMTDEGISLIERCDGLDNNCNGMVDEGLTTNCFADDDADGYAAVGAAMTTAPCGMCPPGYVQRAPSGTNVDCLAGNAEVSPMGTFHAVPYCRTPGFTTCLVGATLVCTTGGCPGTMSETPSYDYDCSGAEEGEGGCGPCGGSCRCR